LWITEVDDAQKYLQKKGLSLDKVVAKLDSLKELFLEELKKS